jgi:hypothetical protein
MDPSSADARHRDHRRRTSTRGPRVARGRRDELHNEHCAHRRAAGRALSNPQQRSGPFGLGSAPGKDAEYPNGWALPGGWSPASHGSRHRTAQVRREVTTDKSGADSNVRNRSRPANHIRLLGTVLACHERGEDTLSADHHAPSGVLELAGPVRRKILGPVETIFHRTARLRVCYPGGRRASTTVARCGRSLCS